MKSRPTRGGWLSWGYGDTDEWAHAGNYRLYLEAANDVDRFIRELWETAQADPFYKDQTTFIITCDHGRGVSADKGWFHHSREVDRSNETWLMAFGAGVPAKACSPRASITTIRWLQRWPRCSASALRRSTRAPARP